MNIKKKIDFDAKWLGLLFLISVLGIFTLAPIWQRGGEAALGSIPFGEEVVDAGGLENIWLKTVGDLNGDGLVDLIAGGNAGGGLVWYESPTWTKHTIDSDGGFRTDGEVADVDRDGDQDVVVLATGDVRWYENPGWAEHIIEERVLHDLEVSDFDGDGDVDLVARNQSLFSGGGDVLHFYRQDSPGSWTYRAVSCSDGEGLKVMDVDRDTDQDVVIEGVWLENTKNIVGGGWTAYPYTSSWTHPHAFVNAGDLNKDGRMDIVLAPSEPSGSAYRISWFEAPTDPKAGNWTEHIVENNVEAIHHYVGVADLDKDGDQDIVAAEMEQGSNPDEVKVYRNGDGVGGVWEKQVIATTGSHSMRILDVGKDGDNDLYGANWEGNQVELWLNQTCQANLDNWERHVIDASRPWRAIFITAGDMDQDGRRDIVSGGWWYKNPGSPGGSWLRKTIGSPLNNLAAVRDFDGDGLLDVLGTMGQGSEADARFVWARNNGGGSFSLLSNIEPGVGDFLQGIAVGSLDAGGGLQAGLSWHAAGNGIQMLSVPSNPLAEVWTMEEISDVSQDEALSMGDIDRDGDQDLLLGTLWLEQDGGAWIEHILHDTSGSAYGESNPDRNRLVDMNEDGYLDALVGYEAISVAGKLAWYEQAGDAEAIWQEHEIATVVGPMSVDAADVDGDGDLDVIVGEHNLAEPASARLMVYENVNGLGSQWQGHVVYEGDEHHDGAQVVDIDQDADLDIISIGWNHPQVLLYENTKPTCAKPPSTPTVKVANTLTPIAPNIPSSMLSKILAPLSLSTQGGSTSGSLASLGLLEQSGTNDNPAAYISFQTPGTSSHTGYQSFYLPGDVQAPLVSTMLLQINFKGPASTTQKWTWSIHDWNTGNWVMLGDNSAGISANTWRTLLFRINNARSYISPVREIRIRLSSNNANGDAKVDYEALHLTYRPVASAATPVAPTVPARRPGIASARIPERP